jgi:hypothetical protein
MDLIQLDKATIERALPLVSEGLEKYCRIQAALSSTDVARDRAFQTSFNGFYRVRRNGDWQSAFYTLLEQEKSQHQSFGGVLRSLYAATGRVEASFSSKLAASIDPDKPVIDSVVLKNVGLRLSRTGTVEARLARVVELHDHLGQAFSAYLATDIGRHLIARFEQSYPDRHLTKVKMLDLILWKTR